jgi:hypothetical protein
LPGDQTLQVPPVGKPDSDKRVTIDPYAKLDALGRATSEQEQAKIVRELAWATNQGVPMIPIVGALIQGVLNTNGWEYPPVDSPAVTMKSAAFLSLMFQSGVLRATK